MPGILYSTVARYHSRNMVIEKEERNSSKEVGKKFYNLSVSLHSISFLKQKQSSYLETKRVSKIKVLRILLSTIVKVTVRYYHYYFYSSFPVIPPDSIFLLLVPPILDLRNHLLLHLCCVSPKLRHY